LDFLLGAFNMKDAGRAMINIGTSDRAVRITVHSLRIFFIGSIRCADLASIASGDHFSFYCPALGMCHMMLYPAGMSRGGLFLFAVVAKH
jgi:hypothetical protein